MTALRTCVIRNEGGNIYSTYQELRITYTYYLNFYLFITNSANVSKIIRNRQ